MDAKSGLAQDTLRAIAPQDTDEINFKEMIQVAWRGRWLILTASAIVAGVTFGVVSFIPKRFEATVLLSPVSEDLTSAQRVGSGALGAVSSQLGGLASLAGISGSQGGFKAEALATLQSQTLTEEYVRQNNLLPILFEDRWNPATKDWDTNDPKKIPTLWKANQLFSKRLRVVTENPKTGLSLLTVTWTDPVIAAEWANGLVKMTNAYLRDKAIASEERRIAYLKGEALKTDIVELRQGIYSLMENEINREMLARGSDEYALKIVDPATPPEEASWPRRLIFSAVALFGAMLISTMYVLSRGRIGSYPNG